MAKKRLNVNRSLSRYPEWMRATALDLRALIKGLYPDLLEVLHKDETVFMINYSRTPKAGDAFCVISVHDSYVSLDFNRDIVFQDPRNVLRSAGDLYQSLKLTEGKGFSRAYVRKLIQQAYEESTLTVKGNGDEAPVQPILRSVAPKKNKRVSER